MQDRKNDSVQICENINEDRYEITNIKKIIHKMRGSQVMLDADVAIPYKYENKQKNNIQKLSENLCFQNNQKEVEIMFNRLVSVEYKLLEYEKRFTKIFDKLQKDENNEQKQKIFFEGQIYDSYSLIIDIIKTAQKKILIIDNYIDYSILKMLVKKSKNVEVTIITLPNCNLTKLDVSKFNKQYPTLKIVRTSKFHDRFILIDDVNLYHCGASLKDLGKKCFAISKIEDVEYVDKIKSTLKKSTG